MSSQKATIFTTNDSKSISIDLIVQQLAKGEVQALEEIYRMFFHKLLYYGHQVVSEEHHDKIEDAIQEFFIWLSQNYTKVSRIRNFESYMFQAVRRNLMAKLSLESRANASKERYLNSIQSGASTVSSPEHIQIEKEESLQRSMELKNAIDLLPNYQREILYLRFFEGKSYAEIAEILSINEQVAYNYVSRAIKRLRKYLGSFTLIVVLMWSILSKFF